VGLEFRNSKSADGADDDAIRQIQGLLCQTLFSAVMPPAAVQAEPSEDHLPPPGPPPTFPSLDIRQLTQSGALGDPIVANSRTPIPLPSDVFDGEMLIIVRHEDDEHYERRVFEGRQRRLEMQVQGKFRKLPEGREMYIGAEASTQLRFGLVTRALSRVLLAFVQAKVKLMHYSFGDKKNAELPHMVLPLWVRGSPLLLRADHQKGAEWETHA